MRVGSLSGRGFGFRRKGDKGGRRKRVTEDASCDGDRNCPPLLLSIIWESNVSSSLGIREKRFGDPVAVREDERGRKG